jgi:glutaredoxin
MRATVWSKDQCPYCVMAKDLLRTQGIEYEERNISQGEWTREQLMEAVPYARTLPQIFIDDQLIGGYDALKKHFNKK